jgi:hypothetical protein
MGAVYLARERALDRLVAVKVLVPHDGDTAESRERFIREARTAANLTHPNIVPLYAFGEAEGILYFVMGYVPGESLRTLMRRRGRLPVHESRRILADLADALDYAHRQGVVHRDVKPDNVLIDDGSGRAMLADFGLARAHGAYHPVTTALAAAGAHAGQDLTRAGSIVGTPHYMSPEQALGEGTIEARIDVYSLGVMAYEMLSGRRPFEGETVQEILAKRLTEDPVPVKSVAPEVDETLAEVVTRCLARNPVFRWQDAGSLRAALAADRTVEELNPESLPALGGSLLAPFFCAGLVVAFSASHRSANLVDGLLFLSLGGVLSYGRRYQLLKEALRKKGHGTREILRASLWPPRWWRWWYPRRLRPPGSVWDRLPAQVRAARNAPLISLGAFLGSYLLLQLVPASGNVGAIVLAGLLLAFGVAFPAWLRQRFYRWAADHGFDWADGRRLLHEPPTKPFFWKEPQISRLLLAPAAPSLVSASPEPRSPRDLLQAIVQVADGLAKPFRSIGSEAVAAARRLLSSLESLDGELARLARDTEPGETARILARLEAMGTEPVANSDGRDQARELLAKQRNLLRGLEATLEAARTRRGRLLDLLKTLWLQLANLRAQTAVESERSSEISGHVRALCVEIEQLARVFGSAEADVSTLTQPR